MPSGMKNSFITATPFGFEMFFFFFLNQTNIKNLSPKWFKCAHRRETSTELDFKWNGVVGLGEGGVGSKTLYVCTSSSDTTWAWDEIRPSAKQSETGPWYLASH